jgi:hypothetical protein
MHNIFGFVQVLNACGLLPATQIFQDEPASDYFIETPTQEMAVERWLPSVGTFLAFCAASAVAVISVVAFKLTGN